MDIDIDINGYWTSILLFLGICSSSGVFPRLGVFFFFFFQIPRSGSDLEIFKYNNLTKLKAVLFTRSILFASL